jgi:hypothetical protein
MCVRVYQGCVLDAASAKGARVSAVGEIELSD